MGALCEDDEEETDGDEGPHYSPAFSFMALQNSCASERTKKLR